MGERDCAFVTTYNGNNVENHRHADADGVVRPYPGGGRALNRRGLLSDSRRGNEVWEPERGSS